MQYSADRWRHVSSPETRGVTPRQTIAPFLRLDREIFSPQPIAQGGWGPTIGGQIVGGLLARSVEATSTDPDLHPARLTVDILRRVALRPLRVTASVLGTGRRMQAVDAEIIQDNQLVARASALFLRRGEQPESDVWPSPIAMPSPQAEQDQGPDSLPMFIRCYRRNPEVGGDGSHWRHHGPKFAWVREVKPRDDDETLTPFVRAAMAVDLTSSAAHFSEQGRQYINADYTLTLSRLPQSDIIGPAAAAHYSDSGSFFSLLQKNVLDRRRRDTREQLRIAIVTWIEPTTADADRRPRPIDPDRIRSNMTPAEHQAA
jgi:acyl-coenzyme A thioesterase PaaI-like protein